MDEIWHSDSIITNQMIVNSFKFAGISSKLSGNEEDQFRGNKDLEKQNETIEFENEEALDQENDYVTSYRSYQ